jgi:hypothetical protein
VNRFDIAVHPLESGVDFSPGYTEQAGVEHVWQPPFNARLYREQGNGDSGQVTSKPEGTELLLVGPLSDSYRLHPLLHAARDAPN